MLEELQRKVESVEMELKDRESCVAEVRTYVYIILCTAECAHKKPVQSHK